MNALFKCCTNLYSLYSLKLSEYMPHRHDKYIYILYLYLVI